MTNNENRIKKLEEALAASQTGERWVTAVLGVAQSEREEARQALAAVVAERDALRACLGAVRAAFRAMRAAWNQVDTVAGPVPDMIAGMKAIDAALGGVPAGPPPVDEVTVLRAACEAVTGTVGLPAAELAARVLAGVQRAGEAAARARLHEGDPAAAIGTCACGYTGPRDCHRDPRTGLYCEQAASWKSK